VNYIVSIEIALPRARVVQLLADSAQLPKWLRGLVLHEPLSGMHGQSVVSGPASVNWSRTALHMPLATISRSK
jgi:hypothetical protein